MEKRVGIILVNWNGKADTLECLRTLEQERYRHKRLYVVDNGSSDGSAEAIKQAYPQVEVIHAGTNLGFTGGNNLGIEHALKNNPDYILLLNNDTTVEPDAVTQLIDATDRHPEAGLLTSVIQYYDHPEESWFAGSKLNLERGEAVHDNSQPRDRYAPDQEIPWASGCVMLIPVDVIHQLGGFDNRYFLNWEDVDLSLRVRKLDRPIFVIPSSRVYHKVGRSVAKASGPACYYYTRNYLLLLRSHSHNTPLLKCVCLMQHHWRALARALRRNEPNSGLVLLSALHGFVDALFGRFGAKKKFWYLNNRPVMVAPTNT